MVCYPISIEMYVNQRIKRNAENKTPGVVDDCSRDNGSVLLDGMGAYVLVNLLPTIPISCKVKCQALMDRCVRSNFQELKALPWQPQNEPSQNSNCYMTETIDPGSTSTAILLKSIFQPTAAFEHLSKLQPAPWAVLLRYSLWLLLLPPLFSWIGAAAFGWRLGADQPLVLNSASLTLISLSYFLVLLFGITSTALISCWMASTYGANANFGRHFALITIVGEPLALASIAHLYPDVFFNLLVMIPAIIWSMYLLYKGIPIALDTPPERGILMASSLVAWLLVAAVSLLGISMGLWTNGVGPLLGV